MPDPDADLRVEHAPMAYPEEPSKQMEVEAQELAMGLEDYVSLMQRRRPELTRDSSTSRSPCQARRRCSARLTSARLSRTRAVK